VFEFTVLSWNLFHGRDHPPGRHSRRSAWRLSGKPSDVGSYLDVNRSLLDEFAALISETRWLICLLQEAPPAWAHTLAARCEAEVFCSPTSRNQLAPVTRWIAHRRPDLIGSWEGGSNTTLVRPPWRIVPGSTRPLLLNPWRERGLRERRRMAFVRLRAEGFAENGVDLCVANFHAGQTSRSRTARQVVRAAKASLEWAGGSPLLLGGDFNLRPHTAATVFECLKAHFGLAAPTGAHAIDHLLVRGLETVVPPWPWPPERRELGVAWAWGKRRIRLSDHAPVEAAFAIETPHMR
jgi:endonuclease/exonuclease/phosphatase family metal-dependent hydrolase